MRLKLDKNGAPEINRVYLCANILIIVAFSLIFSRLWYLQILRGEYFRDLSEHNRIRIQEISAPRGILFDRQGTPLGVADLRNHEAIFGLFESDAAV